MSTGSAHHLVPVWAWFVVFVVLLVAEVIVRRLVKAGRISADSVWARPASHRAMRTYFLFRVGLLVVVVAVTLIVSAIRHAG